MAWKRILMLGWCAAWLAGCAIPRARYGVKIEGLGDSAEDRVRVSTYSSGRPARIPVGSQDWFFRGYVDKETRAVKYRFCVIFHSGQTTLWGHASFPAADGETVSPVRNVRTSLYCTDAGCDSYEKLTLAVDRATLAQWAKSGATVKFTSESGSDSRTVTVDAEEAGRFLQKMDEVAAGEL